MLLYVDACVRGDSRTKRLADCLVRTLQKPYTRLRLEACAFPKVDEAFLNRRDRLIGEGSFADPMFDYARQFAEADEIVIAAPFWDLSFPAALKAYLEQITVVGLTLRYTPEGSRGTLQGQTAVLRHDGGRGFLPGAVRIWLCAGAGPELLRH